MLASRIDHIAIPRDCEEPCAIATTHATTGAAGATHLNGIADREAAATATTTVGVASVAISTCRVAQIASSCETGSDLGGAWRTSGVECTSCVTRSAHTSRCEGRPRRRPGARRARGSDDDPALHAPESGSSRSGDRSGTPRLVSWHFGPGYVLRPKPRDQAWWIGRLSVVCEDRPDERAVVSKCSRSPVRRPRRRSARGTHRA
jgi:hypothetical protein